MSHSILIAEDTEDIRDLLTVILQGEGYEVHAMTDGLEALTWLEEHPAPDLIITDYQMPRVNGAALVAAIRLNAKTRSIPIIVASGSHMDEIQKVFIKDQVLLLPKPFDLDRIIEMVKRTISEHRGE